MEQENNIKTSFLDDLESSLHIQANYESRVLNYTWVEMFEDVLPYIDNILRNPKRFIINEEDIVLVEKSKKVTVESVIHLCQHTNFIEKFDEKSGEVRPSKILNINKEESLDTYENRFIHTLIKNMTIFYDKHKKSLEGGSYFVDEKKAEYESVTKIGTENVKMKVQFESLNKNIEDQNTDEFGHKLDPIDLRLKRIKQQLDGFKGAEMMINLDKLHVPDVVSPIKKTNAILKNPNFQKAVQMWNYIQSYTTDDVKDQKTNKDYMDTGDILNQFDQSFMYNYLAMQSLSKKVSIQSEKKVIAMTLAKVIENILDIDDELMISKVRAVFTDEFKEAKKKTTERNNKIASIFNSKLDKNNNRVIESINILK